MRDRRPPRCRPGSSESSPGLPGRPRKPGLASGSPLRVKVVQVLLADPPRQLGQTRLGLGQRDGRRGDRHSQKYRLRWSTFRLAPGRDYGSAWLGTAARDVLCRFSSRKLTLLISSANEISGSQTGSQRSQTSGDERRRPATTRPASWLVRRPRTTPRDGKTALYKRGVTGSNPVAPTRSGYMLTLMGDFPGTIAGATGAR